jgi:hypothetical protein
LGPPAGWGAQDDPVELIVEIDGDIRGWLRPDGALDLVLSTYRDLVFADGSSAFGETGFKAVRVEPGEAVRLVLPGAPGGKPGDGRYAGYLEGHAFSLILVARPQP